MTNSVNKTNTGFNWIRTTATQEHCIKKIKCNWSCQDKRGLNKVTLMIQMMTDTRLISDSVKHL